MPLLAVVITTRTTTGIVGVILRQQIYKLLTPYEATIPYVLRQYVRMILRTYARNVTYVCTKVHGKWLLDFIERLKASA